MIRADRVILNISGEIYETRLKTLERFPTTLLGDKNKRVLYYCSTSGQHFMFRNKLFFDAILYFYQSNGVLQCPCDIPVELFEEECRYFELPQFAIDDLTRPRNPPVQEETVLTYASRKKRTFRAQIWAVLQEPNTSRVAKYYAWLSMMLIFASVAASCLETIDDLKVAEHDHNLKYNPWAISELALNLFFLSELLLSIVTAPSITKYFLLSMTWVDIIAVLPYFLFMAFSDKEMTSLGFLRVVRLMRVVRVFRLSKQSKRLQVIAKVLSSCLEEFKSLMIIILITVILCGSIMYYIERQFPVANTKTFTDIPNAMYWGIQTITTLGYGDITPKSIPGMIFAGFVMLFGSIILAIPVQTVITKYQEQGMI